MTADAAGKRASIIDRRPDNYRSVPTNTAIVKSPIAASNTLWPQRAKNPTIIVS
jgi:hypothetical protein